MFSAENFLPNKLSNIFLLSLDRFPLSAREIQFYRPLIDERKSAQNLFMWTRFYVLFSLV